MHEGGAPQPAINITFDLHSDPHPQNLTLDQRRQYFRRQLDNARWLLEVVEPYGVKISFLAVGEFYEFCVEPTERTACFELLRRLHASGGIIGTHQHGQYARGVHDWPDIANLYTNPAEADVRAVWQTNQAFTNQAIAQAFELEDAAAIAALNTSCESHAQLADPNQLMTEYGYTIREGGTDQDLVPLFGHVPWNPYRPGATPLLEDPGTPFITIPQGMVIGEVGLHKGYEQDGRSPRKQAELLELYATWLARERTGAAPKVWTFGWGVHTQDLDEGSASRAGIVELIPWIKSELIDRDSPAGNEQARFAGYLDVRDEYAAWERDQPGTSSFSYALDRTDYAAYPYLEWANRYLRAASLDGELAAPAGRLFSLAAGGSALVLAVGGDDGEVIDVSMLGETVRRIDLESGMTREVDASSAPTSASAAVFCAPAACDAILALGEASAPDDLCSAADPACPDGKVCADVVGRCVPDCRLGTPCPQNLTCGAEDGVCR